MNKKILIIIGITALVIIVGSFWYVKEKKQTSNSDQQASNKKWIKDSQQLRTEFETFIKEHGQKIELEKIDTTGWKTYIDEKRKFSFQYPSDWYVVHIEESLEDDYSPRKQRIEKRMLKQYATNCEETFDSSSDIKGCTHSYAFLCVTDKYSYEEIPKRFKDANTIKGPINVNFSKYCDIIIEESFPSLKLSKKSSGRMRLESYMAYSDFSHIKYISNDAIYLVTSTTPTLSFDFLELNGNFITVRDTNFGTPIITQTIKYTE